MDEMKTITVGDKQIRTSHQLRVVNAIHGSGTITREYSSLKPSKAICRGCYENHYNHSGNSTSGECWGFSTARVVDKVGHTSIYVEGGPDGRMIKTHSCWHSVQK